MPRKSPWYSADLNEEVRKRYGAAPNLADARPGERNPESAQFGSRLMEDMGLGAYKVPYGIRPLAEPQKGYRRLGQFNEVTGRLEVDPYNSDSDWPATLTHELGHMADSTVVAPDDRSIDTMMQEHHRMLPDFDNEMARSMKAQSAIEKGEKLPAAVARYPWLKDVVPLSSNRLANPWSGVDKMDSDFWNEIKAMNRRGERK